MSLCEKCAADCRHERLPNEIVVHCGSYRPAMTNGDRLRAMSDEELAKFLCELRSSESYGFPCSECVAEEFCHDGHTGMIDWLNLPAEEG